MKVKQKDFCLLLRKNEHLLNYIKHLRSYIKHRRGNQ
jgi:hypothetical protein